MKHAERFEDMSPRGRLRLLQEDDGDLIVAVVPDPNAPLEYAPSVQFCTIGNGGGKSPRTRRALQALMEAIAEDNRCEGEHRRGEHGMGSAEDTDAPSPAVGTDGTERAAYEAWFAGAGYHNSDQWHAWLARAALASRPVDGADTRDWCTDPDNCRRCKAPAWDQHKHHHAGIPLAARTQPAQGEGE